MALQDKNAENSNCSSDIPYEYEFKPTNPEEEGEIFPIFKTGQWLHAHSDAVNQNLLSSEEQELVVTFGDQSSEGDDYLKKSQHQQNFVKEAYQNLAKLQVNFEQLDDYKILTASGKAYSSEKILCKEHMMNAHKMLEADELLVSIPRRSCMYIMDKNGGDDLINIFVRIHKHTWNDDSFGNAQILDGLFIIKNGKITGYIPLGNGRND